MTDFYQRMANTSLRLIADKGVPCTIASLPQQGSFDPLTGMPLDDIPATTQSAQCAVLNYKDVVTNMSESLIQQGDKKILIAAKGVSMPTLGATVNVLDKAYTIVAVKDIKPADVALIYEIHGRE